MNYPARRLLRMNLGLLWALMWIRGIDPHIYLHLDLEIAACLLSPNLTSITGVIPYSATGHLKKPGKITITSKSRKDKMDMILLNVILNLIELAAVLTLCYKYSRVRNQKENEYYTDYRHNNLILRVYKPEFEYEAIGKIPVEKLLDGGTLSQFYKWALIEE